MFLVPFPESLTISVIVEKKLRSCYVSNVPARNSIIQKVDEIYERIVNFIMEELILFVV